jgi:MFS family permease
MSVLQTNAAESQTFSSDEWRIIGVTSIGHTLCHISELSFAAVIGAVMAEFRLSPDRAAAMAVPGFVLYGVLAVPAGLWTDRRGSREVLLGYFVLVALAALIVCFAGSPWQLAVALTLLGAAISLYHPAGLTMISHGCRRRGRAMGINGVAGSLGVAIGGAMGLIFAGYGYWRMTYAVIAGLSLAAAFSVRWLPTDRVAHTPSGSSDSPASSTTTRPVHASEPTRVPWLLLGVLALAMLLGGINYRCLTTALPEYLSSLRSGPPRIGDVADDAKVEMATADEKKSGGLLVFFVLVLGGIGQLVGGHLADRLRPSLVYASAILLTIPCALLMAHATGNTIVLAASVLAVFMFAQQPLENIMIAESTPARWRSTIYGMKFILAFGLASSGAYLTGWVWDLYGLARVFDVFAMIAIAMAGVAVLFAWLRKDFGTGYSHA